MFDLVAVTASSSAQAKGYREQLKFSCTEVLRNALVVPDPGDRRVGSLGATVNLLRQPEISRGKCILVVHSGGDARRTPGYAAMGKAFIPMRDGRSLLEHIVEAMAKLPLPKDGGVLVVSGDVLPRFDASCMDFSRPGVTGVAYSGEAAEARRHGVYVVRGGGKPGKVSKVSDFLQKPDVREGFHLVDTGVMFIDRVTAAKMATLPIEGDIYVEFPRMLLGGYAQFSVNVAGSCDFFHVGSTRELLEKLGDGTTYVDSVSCSLKLAGENVVTNVPYGRFRSLKLAKGECYTCIPYGKGKWLDLKYRIDDNFKTDGLWEYHGLGRIMPNVDSRRLLATRRWGGLPRSVTAPVRIDFAGGWSDTPPICNNEGGCVLNAAVILDGERPIRVDIARRADCYVRIVSRDLGKRRLVKTAAELADHSDPSDWCALVKAALKVSGYIFGEDPGLDIVIRANLPKGSGMGTSSILGAAVLAALLGRADAHELGELTLRLEREMSTGGGWQDQYGGSVGGVKLLESKPGERQEITIEPLVQEWLSALLKERGLLYFTGQKRMARNILRKVLAVYVANPHDFAGILINSLKADAMAGAEAIRRHDAEGFAAAVNGYWRDKKLLDPGSTNDRVEEMVARIADRVSAITLTGAGGGGFMFILAKSRNDAAAIRREFSEKPPSKYSRFYHFALSSDGISFGLPHTGRRNSVVRPD